MRKTKDNWDKLRAYIKVTQALKALAMPYIANRVIKDQTGSIGVVKLN
jgi:hypothetical protein